MSSITLLHGPSGRAVFLAVPAYHGVSAGTTFSLFEAAREVDAELCMLANCCHVDDARNILVARFLESSAEDLVFIDTDVQWEAGALAKILSYDADIVAGSYPKKQETLDFPLRWLEHGKLIEPDEQGLIDVAGAPTGFMRIHRRVLERLAEKAPKFLARDDDQSLTPLIFERGFAGKSRIGGDYRFCDKARAAGFSVKVPPELWFGHAHVSGSLGAWLRQRNNLGLGYCLERLIEDDVTRYCRELYRAWGGKWALVAPGLEAVANLAKRSSMILECGSGLSTLVMAAANPDSHVHALECADECADRVEAEAKRYGLKNVTVHRCPLENGAHGRWYRVPELPASFDLVLVDGPSFTQPDRWDPRARHPLFDYLAREIDGAVIVMDDAYRMTDVMERYEHAVAGKIAICKPRRERAAA